VRGGAQVLIATPGRLEDFMGRGLVSLGRARIVVLDEADRLLDMGFLPSLKRIMAAVPRDRQILLFSATLENSVRSLVNEYAPGAIRIELGSISRPSEQVDLHFYEVEHDRKLDLLENMLEREPGSFLVFARTRRGAERLARRLAHQGVNATAIHGDRSQSQRNHALHGFQQGRYRVLVATDVAARGIHVEGISHVVNYDLPQVPEDFIHRVGRTGRAGARGVASTFGTRAERADVARIERALSISLSRQQAPGITAEPEPPSSPRPPARQWRSFGPSRARRGAGHRYV
jgi:ATP-dependent RNA helicase RhlE